MPLLPWLGHGSLPSLYLEGVGSEGCQSLVQPLVSEVLFRLAFCFSDCAGEIGLHNGMTWLIRWSNL